MLLLDEKKHGIHFYTVWYAEEKLKNPGIVSYREAKFLPDENIKYEKFDTLISDLTESAEEIKQHFAKNCKYKVNRAYRENIQVQMALSKDITDEDIEEFCQFFVTFWESKGVNYTKTERLKQELRLYRDMGALAIGKACVNDEKAVYHTYVMGDDWARLLHSASLYRLSKDEDGRYRNLIGMANRNLHYEEMLFFKECGKTVYDWGGAGTNEEVKSITEFKQSFGGTPATYYEFEQVNGFLAKLFKLAVKILKK